ncbi:hypothetical protein V6Z12_A11G181800 [Gossypium hirsutum]
MCFYPALLQLQRDKDCDFDLLHYNFRETRSCNLWPVALLLRGLRLVLFDLLYWIRDLQSSAYSTTIFREPGKQDLQSSTYSTTTLGS